MLCPPCSFLSMLAPDHMMKMCAVAGVFAVVHSARMSVTQLNEKDGCVIQSCSRDVLQNPGF